MPYLPKHWNIPQPIPPDAQQALHGYPIILQQILYNRGISDSDNANQFFLGAHPSGENIANLFGIAPAVERIQTAIQNRQPIAIYGDYDTDGVTATALLVDVLNLLNADVRGYIPNRFDEGYGLNKEALASLREDGVALVITVDCGIRSVEEAQYAREIGLDLIITDHHHPGSELPEAISIINPKQPEDHYPFKDLAGVGIAYKLACGLQENNHIPDQDVEKLLDLVALGTVADMAPLNGENRYLVREGLKYLMQPHRQGLYALCQIAGLDIAKISAGDIGFRIGPRLNAAGRLDSAQAAYDLLTTRDVMTAGRLAQQLEVQNRDRQELTRAMQAEAEQIILGREDTDLILFACSPDFNPGVVGLVASRLVETHYRPAIVAYQGDDFTRASCRSIQEFHITNALDQCSDILEHHGGHAAAAGFTVHNDNLAELIDRLQAIANQELGELELRPSLNADMELTLDALHPDVVEWLSWIEPTGYGNPRAYFVTRNLRVVNARAVGRDGSHLKLTVTDGHLTFDAIAFRQGFWIDDLPARIDVLYTFEENEYNGKITYQLNIRDIQPSS